MRAGKASCVLLLLAASQIRLYGEGAGRGSPRTDWNDYTWPTEAGRIVTSTFGEYRRFHFHAGIDISSGDVSGYRVVASRSGYVARIRISPSGYGKILYIRHPDGFTTTYAHLERFAPALDERAAREQRALGRYPVDIACTPGDFPVRKGDLVGLTGETGAASPHLHFEIRDPDGNPVNPFFAPRLRVPDTIPPTITRIRVSPLSPDASVDGGSDSRSYRGEGTGRETSRVAAPIVITGTAGFSVESRDRIPGSRFRNGVYARSLDVDGATVYADSIGATPWNEAHEIEMCYEHPEPGAGGGRFARLFKDSPNHLPFYTPRLPRAGIIDCGLLRPGPHSFRITTADFAGNAASITGTFIVSRVPRGSAVREGREARLRLFSPGDVQKIKIASAGTVLNRTLREWPAPSGGFPPSLLLPLPSPGDEALTVTLENRWGTVSPPMIIAASPDRGGVPPLHIGILPEEEYVRVEVTAPGVLSLPPSVTVEEGSARSTVVMSAAGAGDYRGWFRPREEFRGIRLIRAEAVSLPARTSDSSSIDIEPILPGSSGTIEADSGNFLLQYDSLSVLKPLFLRIEKSTGDEGPVYALEPGEAVLGSGLRVRLRTRAGDDGRRGLFYRSGGSWQYIGSRGDREWCTGSITALGEVTVLSDTTPPSVAQVSVTHRGGDQPWIVARFRDERSGVEYDDLKMYIDGKMVIPEIDGRRHRAVYHATEPLARGPHQLTMRLTDRIGNSSTTGRRFVLP